MMVSMETALLRGKRRAEAWMDTPVIRVTVLAAAYCLGALVLAAGAIWGRMQPVALGLICASPGCYCLPAAVGAAVGYRVFWGGEAIQGILWSAGALALRLGLDKWYSGEGRAGRLAAGTACLVSGTGLAMQILAGDGTSLECYLLRIALGAGSVYLFVSLWFRRDRTARYLAGGVAVLALAGVKMPAWLNLGCVAAGVLAGAEALPASALAGLGLEIASVTELPMTAALCLSCFCRLLPAPGTWRRAAAPSLACLAVMGLSGVWDWGAWFALSLGGGLGALIPWHLDPLSRHTGTGAVQVQLERLAGTMSALQRLLLDISPPEVDDEALAERLRHGACESCSARNSCMEQEKITGDIFQEPMDFQCRKSGRLFRELQSVREQRKRLQADRLRQEEYRAALTQQYGFLASCLRLSADRLGRGEGTPRAFFRIQVSARARRKEWADGDRCIAFPGLGAKYYVLLCDGMGTGAEAAEEAENASRLLRQMLAAGMPAQYALGSVNAHLALGSRGGAVTLDLAEVRLDTGKASVYKWGAAPSYYVRRERVQRIGTAAPPPGLSVTDWREWASRLSLDRGEVLVLVSDGVEVGETPAWASLAENAPTGELAEQILREGGGSGEDDATVAVIRLCPASVAS